MYNSSTASSTAHQGRSSGIRRPGVNTALARGARGAAVGLMSRALRALCLGLAIAAPITVSTDTHAQSRVYRWTDADGNLVVSDRPPADASIRYELVSPRTSRPSSPPAPTGSASSGTESSTGGEASDAAPGAAGSTGPSVVKDPDICAAARSNLNTLETFARIRVRGADGEMRYLDESEKEAQRDEARALIRLHCPEEG